MADEALDRCLEEIKANAGKFYVYVLSRPCGAQFYVGMGASIIGRRARVLDHEAQALAGKPGHKCSIIRKVWREGLQIIRQIDSWHTSVEAAAARESHLVRSIGRRDLGTGPLSNLTDGGDGLVNPSPSTRAKAAARLRKLHDDADFAKRRDDKIRAVNNNPEIVARRDKAVRRANARPENARRISDQIASLNADPSFIEAATRRIMALNADPEFVEKHRELRRYTMFRLKSDPEFNRKQSDAAKKQHTDPIFLEKIRAGQARVLNDPVHMKKMRNLASKTMSSLWTKPAFRSECSKRASIRMRELHSNNAEFRETVRKASSKHAKRLQADPVFMAANRERMVARHSDPAFVAKAKAGRDSYIAEIRDLKLRCALLSAGVSNIGTPPRSKKVAAWIAYEAELLKVSNR